VGFEFARSQDWLAAIPLLHLGYGVADVPALAQGASWFGVYGLSAWMVAVSAALVGASHVGPRARFALVATLALPLAPGLVGGERGDDALRIAAVQPAIDEAERHVPERLHANLGRLLELTEDALDAPADLLAWPESAWERALGPAGDAFLAAIAHDLGTPLVTGAWQVPAAGRADWRNTAVLATAEGRATVVAEKVHPVPVYERAPDGPITNALARAGLWSGRFGPGDPSAPLTVSRANRAPAALGVLVCIDTSHPELARALRRGGARLLVAIANEAGSGGWSATLQARAARLRAIENRVPVLRVANTGPTLWIDARGHVVAALAAGAPGAAAHTLSLAGAPPPFVAIGDRGVVAAWLSSALAIGAVRVLRKRDHSRGIDR
jgi:apolipoprotein N-acyltransferase